MTNDIDVIIKNDNLMGLGIGQKPFGDENQSGWERISLSDLVGYTIADVRKDSCSIRLRLQKCPRSSVE